MDKRLISSVVGLGLLVFSGMAHAQCENLRVIVRNSVYPINGLEAFCTEFNKMKADLAGMRAELARARDENAMLKARLVTEPGPTPAASPIARAAAGGDSPR